MRTLEEQEFLDRLNHKTEDADSSLELAKKKRMLVFRNFLNGIFMLLATAAMICIGFYWFTKNNNVWTWGILLGISAVFFKMFEVVFRMMSSVLRKSSTSRRRQHL